MTEYMINFCFGRGVQFRSPKETEAIIPDLLKRVWEVDNDKQQVLWEMGQQGGVSGDCFVKVAYEEPWQDTAGGLHPGRVRVLPLNASFCMPVSDTEILTQRGWLSADQVQIGDKALSLDPTNDELVWSDVERVNRFSWNGPMHEWRSERFSALSTPDHRWVYETGRGKRVIRTSGELQKVRTGGGGRLVLAGGLPTHFANEAKYSNEFVELVGWVVTEGTLESGNGGIAVTQSNRHNPHFVDRIESLAAHFEGQGHGVWRRTYDDKNMWRLSASLGHEVRAVLTKNKGIDPGFLVSLTGEQADLLFNTLLDGDGDTRRARGEYFWQNNWEVMDSFQMLAMMLGKRSHARLKTRTRTYDDTLAPDGCVSVYKNRHHYLVDLAKREVHYEGDVWCPTTATGTWVARRKEVMEDGSSNKVIYLTGNCFP